MPRLLLLLTLTVMLRLISLVVADPVMFSLTNYLLSVFSSFEVPPVTGSLMLLISRWNSSEVKTRTAGFTADLPVALVSSKYEFCPPQGQPLLPLAKTELLSLLKSNSAAAEYVPRYPGPHEQSSVVLELNCQSAQ